jgi:hypothetical protein
MRKDIWNGVRRDGRALATCALTLLWLAVLTIGALAVNGTQTAQAHGASVLRQQSSAMTGAETPTSTPLASTPTPTEGVVTPTAGATHTISPTRAPTRSSFTPGPQPTRVNFSQPTVGAATRFDSPGITGAPEGPNGMVIATVTSCITALLAIVTTVIAFTVLRRGGYAPFLRLLLLGARGARSRGKTARDHRGGRRSLGAYDDEVNRPIARDAGGRYRDSYR